LGTHTLILVFKSEGSASKNINVCPWYDPFGNQKWTGPELGTKICCGIPTLSFVARLVKLLASTVGVSGAPTSIIMDLNVNEMIRRTRSAMRRTTQTTVNQSNAMTLFIR
jgi:hypothetical protein